MTSKNDLKQGPFLDMDGTLKLSNVGGDLKSKKCLNPQ